MARDGLVTINNAKFFKRNFAGKQLRFNPEGRRNFCVFIDDLDVAHRMKEDGWNVRFLPPRDENESERAFIQVAVNFGFRPPKIMLVTYPYANQPDKAKLTPVSEEEVGMLDWAEIETADLTINPSRWENERGSGIKGYLRTLYVTIYQDELDKKYSDVPSDDSEDGTPWEE